MKFSQILGGESVRQSLKLSKYFCYFPGLPFTPCVNKGPPSSPALASYSLVQGLFQQKRGEIQVLAALCSEMLSHHLTCSGFLQGVYVEQEPCKSGRKLRHSFPLGSWEHLTKPSSLALFWRRCRNSCWTDLPLEVREMRGMF